MKLIEIFDILCEATPGQLLKRSGVPEQLEQTWLQKYGQEAPANEIMNKLVSLAPDNNVNTYIEWLTKLFLKDPNFDVDDKEIKTITQVHNNNRQHLNPNPMAYKSYSDMIDDIKRYEEESGKATVGRTKKREGEKGGVTGEGVKEVIPGRMYQLDQKAAEKYGSDTWCISNPGATAETRAMLYDNYSKNGSQPFFMLTLPEMDPRYSKIGVFPGESGGGEFQDVQNKRIPNHKKREIWKEYPEIYEQMKPYISDENWAPLPQMSREEVLAMPRQSSDLYLSYAHELGGERWPEIEGYLLEDDDLNTAVHYAKDILGQRWPELEKELLTMKDPEAVALYAENFFKDKGWPAAEKALLSNPAYYQYLGDYAKGVLNGKWDEAEYNLMVHALDQPRRGALLMCMYARVAKGGPWEEAEPWIMKYPDSIAFYANNILGRRWTEAEPEIMEDPKKAVEYAEKVIKGRWPEAEDSISKDKVQWFLYLDFLKRLP